METTMIDISSIICEIDFMEYNWTGVFILVSINKIVLLFF